MTPALAPAGFAPAIVATAARVLARFAPPSEIRPSQFADAELIVTSGPLQGTRMNTQFAPYQPAIMDAFEEPGVQTVVVKGSSQWGKTLTAQVIVAYHAKHDPCEILVVEPNLDPMAKDFSKNRLDPMIRASPALREVFAKQRSRDSSNTVLLKTFHGGFVAITGSESAAGLAARTIRLLVLDEVNRYITELKGEGSPIDVAMMRTEAYGARRRVLMLSSPTLVGGPIDIWHAEGDQRLYFVPCPKCGHMHPFEWKNLRWVNREPATARLHCPACDYRIDDVERIEILKHGEWRATNPDRPDKSIVSFHLWAAYSPLSSLPRIVARFLKAYRDQKRGDKTPMHTFQNTTLAEAHEPDQGEGVEPHSLLKRRESFGPPLDGGVAVDMLPRMAWVTMGVDTQDDRLEALMVAWGPGEESCLIDRVVLWGDTDQPEVWLQLSELLGREYQHPGGLRLGISAACIDTAGHRTVKAYEWAYKHKNQHVFAVIGRDGDRAIVSAGRAISWGRENKEIKLFTVGVDAAKDLIVGRLGVERIEPEGDAAAPLAQPGYVHIPIADWANEDLAKQLTSERLVKRFHKGVPIEEWRQVYFRNEMLDCFVYALAALSLRPVKLQQKLEQITNPPEPPAPAPPKPPGWLPRREGGWLKKGNR